MESYHVRAMRDGERRVIAEIVCESIRCWYAAAGRPGRFPGGAESCLLFPDVYEDLDPGCCAVVEDLGAKRLAGCCFYHPRSTHVALGIMSVHPDYFGKGVGHRLLAFVCEVADRATKPVRLVSSAMNIDSFSLYNRAGFVPRDVFQVMTMGVPESGIGGDAGGPNGVRVAGASDVTAMVALERRVSGIEREKDLRYFIENRRGIWRTLIAEDARGEIRGFLVSIRHPGSTMIGPGVMLDDEAAMALVHAQLNHLKGASPACLVPTSHPKLAAKLYASGMRNSELALFQSRGTAALFDGVMIPSFMPETG
jgi:GNAT superfamily N-acetyltransferase